MQRIDEDLTYDYLHSSEEIQEYSLPDRLSDTGTGGEAAG